MTDQAPEAAPVTYPEHAPQFDVIHEQPAIAAPEPAKKPQGLRFSAANAREMQARAVAARKERQRLREEAERQATQPSQPPPVATVPAISSPELTLVQEQIERVTAQLRDPMEPNERAQLVRALDLMLDRKRILQERPLPGSRRPAPETSRPRAASLFGAPQLSAPSPGSPEQE